MYTEAEDDSTVLNTAGKQSQAADCGAPLIGQMGKKNSKLNTEMLSKLTKDTYCE